LKLILSLIRVNHNYRNIKSKIRNFQVLSQTAPIYVS